MVVEANQRAENARVSRRTKHQQSDATALPFIAETFDSCRSERVFQHLPRPDLTLAEMVRVTKPGGWVVVFDPDWGTTSVDCTDLDLERRLARVRAELCLENGYAGRHLFRMFGQQGLAEISIEILPSYLTNYYFAREIGFMDRVEVAALDAGIVTEEELKVWRSQLEQAEAQGVFFVTTSSVLIAGRKKALQL